MGLPGRAVEAMGRAMAPVLSKYVLRRPNLFDAFQRHGVHVLSNHFYNPVSDTRTINPRLFDTASALPGIEMNIAGQLAMMKDFQRRFGAEYAKFETGPVSAPGAFTFDNGMYGPVDAEILYCTVRANKPRRIVEIGSGHSTRLSAMAILANQREDPAYKCDLTCIEPYPSDALRAGFPGLTKLMVEPVEKVPLSMFEGLGEGDILFIDSSHVVKVGSDAQYEFLELLPRVGVGAIVHVHDIFFPFDYPERWVKTEHRFWNEQYVLQAFLMFNKAFEVLWCGTAAEHAAAGDVAAAFPSLARERARKGGKWEKGSTCVCPASFWMKRVR